MARGSSQDVALVEAFNEFAVSSQHATMQGFMDGFRNSVNSFIEGVRGRPELRNRSTLAFQSISYIYQHWITNTKNIDSMEEMRAQMICLGRSLADNFRAAPRALAAQFRSVLRGGECVVVFGHSELLRCALVEANERGLAPHVLALEARPECEGYQLWAELRAAGVECEVLLDCQLVAALERADLAVIGAEAVTENGGAVTATGASTLALCARALSKPLYVLAENFKLSRFFALRQADLPAELRAERRLPPPPGLAHPPGECPLAVAPCDFVPPELIAFIVTDGKILKPAAIPHELFQMYDA